MGQKHLHFYGAIVPERMGSIHRRYEVDTCVGNMFAMGLWVAGGGQFTPDRMFCFNIARS